jgi:hypothetical protein
MKALDDKKRAAIEVLAPGRRSYTALRWDDSDMDTLRRLIALNPWEGEGVDLIHIEYAIDCAIGETKTANVGGEEVTVTHIKRSKIFSFHFATTLYPMPAGTWFSVENMAIRLPLAYDEKLVKDNEAQGFKPSREILEAIKQEEAREESSASDNGEKEITVSDLAKEIGITQQAISKRINRLARDGWIYPNGKPERHLKKFFDQKTANIIKENPHGKNKSQLF